MSGETSEHTEWIDADGQRVVIRDGRLSVYGSPSMTNDSGQVAIGADIPVPMSASSVSYERQIETVIEAMSPHLSLRCAECAGTGIRLVSNLDCYSCDGGIRKDLTGMARAAAIEVLDALAKAADA